MCHTGDWLIPSFGRPTAEKERGRRAVEVEVAELIDS
jgi:hypothetical protein